MDSETTKHEKERSGIQLKSSTSFLQAQSFFRTQKSTQRPLGAAAVAWQKWNINDTVQRSRSICTCPYLNTRVTGLHSHEDHLALQFHQPERWGHLLVHQHSSADWPGRNQGKALGTVGVWSRCYRDQTALGPSCARSTMQRLFTRPLSHHIYNRSQKTLKIISVQFSSDLNAGIYQILYSTQSSTKFPARGFSSFKWEIVIGFQAVKSSVLTPYALNICRKDFPLGIETYSVHIFSADENCYSQ